MITDDKKKELLAAKVGENEILLSIDSKEIKFVVGEKEEIKPLPPLPLWIQVDVHRGVVGAPSGYGLLKIENPEGEQIAITSDRVLLATNPSNFIQYSASGAEYEITDGRRHPKRPEWPTAPKPKKTTRKTKTATK